MKYSVFIILVALIFNIASASVYAQDSKKIFIPDPRGTKNKIEIDTNNALDMALFENYLSAKNLYCIEAEKKLNIIKIKDTRSQNINIAYYTTSYCYQISGDFVNSNRINGDWENYHNKSYLDEDRLAKLKNSISGLENIGLPELVGGKPLLVETNKTDNGQISIPIHINGNDISVWVDTGAGASVISRSLAEKYGFKIIKSNMNVSSATVKKIDNYMAIADEIEIAGLIFKNVAFVVFDDDKLTLDTPQKKLKINGIIGIPLLRSMGAVRFTSHSFFPLSQHELPQDCWQNFSYINDKIVSMFGVNDKNTLFDIDTGASRSELYKTYIDDNNLLLKDAEIKDGHVWSLGGYKKTKFATLKNINFKTECYTVSLNNLTTDIKNSYSMKFIDGNLGINILEEFEDMTIDFNKNKLRLSHTK